LLVRISCTDWVTGGWDIEQSIELARRLKAEGVDLIDCSSGGMVPDAKISVGPGYQVPFAERIRREAGMATAAVGGITDVTHELFNKLLAVVRSSSIAVAHHLDKQL